MERKGAYISLCILFILVKSLLKVAFFLEPMLLCHLLFLLFCLDDAALMAEFFHLSIKELIASELTFQRSVVYRNLDTGLQSNLSEAFFTVG